MCRGGIMNNRDNEIEEYLREQEESLENSEKLEPASDYKIISNRSGYNYSGSENYEHDDTGSIHNYSGVEDDVYSSISEHEDWQEGYDY
jgi:hypothetical protein